MTRKKCRWLHKWKAIGHQGLFGLVSQCDKCGLYRVQNSLLGQNVYGWGPEEQ